LKELKSAGIIKGEIEGNAICYCVDESAIEKLQEYFASVAAILNTKKSACC
jgi:hypothetical protein